MPDLPGEKLIRTRIVGRRVLSPKTFEMELARPPSFRFLPGQRIRLVHGGIDRDYSLASAPSRPGLLLCIRNVKGGALTPTLAALEVGTHVFFNGPHGYFIFRPTERQAVFIATGTGIAPFLSMAESGTAGFMLLHGVAQPQDLYYEYDFRASAALYVPCLSEAAGLLQAPSGSFYGRVTDYIRQRLPMGIYDFYLCGRQEMIRDVTRIVDNRFPGSRIYMETFY